MSVREGREQRKENERCKALSSPSTIESIRTHSKEDLPPLAVTFPPNLRYPTPPSTKNIEKTSYHISFENDLRENHSFLSGLGAGYEGDHENELGQADIKPLKEPLSSEPAITSPDSNSRKRKQSHSSAGDGRSKKQKSQPDEPVLKANITVIESPEKPAAELEVQDVQHIESRNPISYWAAHHTWPKSFTEHNLMASSESTNKRPRTMDPSQSDENSRSQSYSQSRKEGDVPAQYTVAYERHIFTKGLNMDAYKGEELVSEASKNLCTDLEQISHQIIEPIIFPNEAIRKVIHMCHNRNEALVSRDVTPMIMPSIASLYFRGDSSLEHVIDEVNADWHSHCVLEGPRPRPDLAIGLFASAFTDEEMEKLKRYMSVDNWAQVTMHMFFPFLMCEVKCGRDGLDMADRQNMHSCSVAVRALLRIQQEADKYRSEKRMNDLFRKVLVFSISHDQQDARLYGHYAVAYGQKWTYYRYRIRKFDLTDSNSLLAIHNFVRNIYKSYLPVHVRRLKDALAALPDPNELPESGDQSRSSAPSFAASEISLNDDGLRQVSQERDADGFVVPARPASLQNSKSLQNKSRMDRLLEDNSSLSKRLDEQSKQMDELLEDRRSQSQRMDELLENHVRQGKRMDELLEDNRSQRQENERLRKTMDDLLQRLLEKSAH